MATAEIEVVGIDELPTIVEMYGQIYRPARDVEFFRRRFLGRYNVLMLIAHLDRQPVGFYVGFELKPSIFYSWLCGVLPDFRRAGVASQLMEASHEWAKSHEYRTMRFECYNHHRAMLHVAIAKEYDIVGIRWDADRTANLVIFEKALEPDSADE